MATIDEAIKAALTAQIEALELTDDPPIAWPNEHFEAPNPPAPYIDVDFIPNRNTRLVLGSAPHLRQGILQLTVKVPINTGTETADELAGSIAEQFPADLTLFEDDIKVRIQQAPDVLPGSKSANSVWWETVVSIRYESLS